ncbi:TIGR02679 domain-containing protein [Paenibacillus pasadenensis]|uniref:TIGR02679 domain-containing protein n=1 Tax=Paenibacillus pasadenensis TaxID=217090 RepID=UPI00040EB0F5|nr:TIGR02679 domain-containing protein [Paenibacillus pasadenensis]
MTQGQAEQEARAYFLRPGMNRLLQAIWKRYEGLGRIGGKAVVPKLRPEECEALNGFFGTYYRPGEKAEISLSEMELELRRSVFECGLEELYQRLYGEPLLSRSDRKRMSQQNWQALFTAAERRLHAEGLLPPPFVEEWWLMLRSGKGMGYRTLKELWDRGEAEASEALLHATLAWCRLSGEEERGARRPIRKPVLAAEVSGNPHALDRDQPAGRLFFQALLSMPAPSGHSERAAREADQASLVVREGAEDSTLEAADRQEEPPLERMVREAAKGLDTLAAREVYRSWGVLDDDFSSYVHLYRQGSDPSAQSGHHAVWTLAHVEEARILPLVSELFVVENPAVYAALIDERRNGAVIGNAGARSGSPLLLCTSGPASAAALRLMDRLVESGRLSGMIRYSGDYDGKGIVMANVLCRRYRERFRPWRFDRETYADSLAQGKLAARGLHFSPEECRQLSKLRAEWQPDLTARLLQSKRKLFQEELLDLLVSDWMEAFNPNA